MRQQNWLMKLSMLAQDLKLIKKKKKIKALCVEVQPDLKYYDDVAVIEDIFLEETDEKIY